MIKKALSLVLSLIMFVCCIVPFVSNAQSYEAQLLSQGFTSSYVSQLVELHNKYPNWQFKAIDTGLYWSTALSNERKSHSNQHIKKSSSYNSNYYCSCAKCYKDGKYVTYEGGSFVAPSEAAVAYYLDPRNWLSEKDIFQFASIKSENAGTTAGVESVLKPTFMYKSQIDYFTTGGNAKTYTKNGEKITYSTAIADASAYSGLSKYFIASKIVQEIGTTNPQNVSGTSGKIVPFTGIYNYYSIGASGGGRDGLAWACGPVKAKVDTVLYSTYDSANDIGTGTKTNIKSGQTMSWMADNGSYYKVRVYNKLGSNSYSTDGAVGYVSKDDSAISGSYNEPWTNPYKSIYNGAKWIYNNYGTYQYTGYMMKFNVLQSGTHEYMATLQAAVSEGNKTYTAYYNSGTISSKIVFYIPVFKDMPSKPCKVDAPASTTVTAPSTTTTTTTQPTTQAPLPAKPAKVTGLTSSSNGTDYITIKWSKVSGASGYYVYRYSSSTKAYTKVATVKSGTLSYKQTKLNPGSGYSYAVAAYNAGGTGAKSSIYATATKPKQVAIVTPTTASNNHTITAKWNAVSACTGYQVQYSRKKDFSTVIATKTVASKSTKSYVGKNFTKGVTYYVRVRAYKTGGGKNYYGAWSSVKSIKAK